VLTDLHNFVAAGKTVNIQQHARPTRQCVLFDSHITPSAIGVSQRLDHTCGTHYLLNYDNVTVSEGSNGCRRHTCSRHFV